MNRKIVSFFLALFSSTLLIGLFSPLTSAAFNPNHLMDDVIFDNYNSMNATQIDSFLDSFPSSCISVNNGFQAPDPTGYSPSGGYTYSGSVSAGQVIYDAAQAYGINPQVLLTTLQKEESLVSGGSGCSTLQYSAAMGYGCPDGGTTYSYSGAFLYSLNGNIVSSVSGTCVNSVTKVGFTQQIIHAAWLLKFGEQRSEGNIGWAVIKGNWDNSDDLSSCYGGPMTQGTFKRCPSDPVAVAYDGYITIDGASTHMDTGPTAALYWYTPHFAGNQNFVNIFSTWFGSSFDGKCTETSSPVSTGVLFNKSVNAQAQASFMIYSGSSTNCVEFHVWNPGEQTWSSHTASNSANISTADSEIRYADISGNGQDVPVLVVFRNTSSHMVEFHVWNPGEQTWGANIVSNCPTTDPANTQIEFADLDGSGRDVPVLISETAAVSGSGNIEFHVWNPGMTSWKTHIISNSPVINPAAATIRFADIDGSGKDVGVLIGETPAVSGSGKIEFHIWNPGLTSWKTHIISNSQPIDPTNAEILFANISGSNIDQAVLIAGLHGTGTSTGNIEFNVWNPGEQTWASNVVSNQKGI